MTFLNPEYFWLTLFILALFMKNDMKALSVKAYLYIFVFFLLVLALMRPVVEHKPLKSKELVNDVVLGVDLSYSMQATDILPSRLAYAKRHLELLVQREVHTRFGVLGFTTNAIVLSPLTQDSQLLLHLFHALDENLIMTKGSDIFSALKLARKLSKAPYLSVVLFTDGGDKKNYEQELSFALENHLIVNVFMVATLEGSTIHISENELLEDENGDIVVTRENRAIQQLVHATGGVYTKELSVLTNALEQQRAKEYSVNVIVSQNSELFYYFVAAAVVVLLLATTTLRRYFLAFLVLFGMNLDANMLSFMQNSNRVAFEKGVSFYEEGEYEKALESFSRVKSSKPKVKSLLFYNKANTLIRLKEFAKAKEAYRKSLALYYTKEADENYTYIKNVQEEKSMSTGMQKSKKRSQLAKKHESSQKKRKEGGSSNMKVSAAASNGSNQGKKSRQDASVVNLNKTEAKLSSRQYELINKRGVNEKQPW